ncbi:hypothetical protein VDG1235_3167 [Verrucomicrobiia bacterium DG1235]|nr:hypothetical protein VDG1235_3167 [Verrucomicrobiae bacterium DG1235]
MVGRAYFFGPALESPLLRVFALIRSKPRFLLSQYLTGITQVEARAFPSNHDFIPSQARLESGSFFGFRRKMGEFLKKRESGC